MKNTIEVWIIRDKISGRPWTARSGKVGWAAPGHAKNAWNVSHSPKWSDGKHDYECVCIFTWNPED